MNATRGGGRTVTFVYDVVCPFAYLASTQVEAMARRVGASVRWHPVLLGGIYRAIEAPQDPGAQMNPAKAELNRRDMERFADAYGVTLHRHPDHPRRSVNAMRLCVAASDEARPALSADLFAAYWHRGADIADEAVLTEVAARHGLDFALTQDAGIKQRLFETTAWATQRGAFGVPTFFLADDDPRLWWGQDRLWLVERALGGDSGPDRIGALRDRDEGLEPAPAPVAPTRVRFFGDFSSPFSYLASQRVDAVAGRHGVTVQRVPILLGALFRNIGTPDVPMFAMPQPKQDWVPRDLAAWAEALEIPFAFPEHFPIRSVLPLRVALQEPAATGPIERAAWAHGRRIDEPESLTAILDEAGLPGVALVRGAAQPEVKAALRRNTEDAQRLGVCGVPTCVVEREGRLVVLWGQDRLGLLDAILAGWWPPRG